MAAIHHFRGYWSIAIVGPARMTNVGKTCFTGTTVYTLSCIGRGLLETGPDEPTRHVVLPFLSQVSRVWNIEPFAHTKPKKTAYDDITIDHAAYRLERSPPSTQWCRCLRLHPSEDSCQVWR